MVKNLTSTVFLQNKALWKFFYAPTFSDTGIDHPILTWIFFDIFLNEKRCFIYRLYYALSLHNKLHLHQKLIDGEKSFIVPSPYNNLNPIHHPLTLFLEKAFKIQYQSTSNFLKQRLPYYLLCHKSFKD